MSLVAAAAGAVVFRPGPMLPGSGWKKLGQPVPLSNFAAALKSG
jgi:hypothetical protein